METGRCGLKERKQPDHGIWFIKKGGSGGCGKQSEPGRRSRDNEPVRRNGDEEDFTV
jgi:hypothetical protein